jgi:SAM-dependent methyltransferase
MHFLKESTPTLAADPHLGVREYFDRTADYWHSVYDGGGFLNRHMDERRTIILSIVDQVSYGRRLRVLDLGCGTGVLVQYLLQRGHSVAGLDISENMLRKMADSLHGAHGASFVGGIRGLVSDTCFADAQFDVIVCSGVIQYQVEEDRTLHEICRLLKDDGFCVFTLPNLLCIGHLADPVYFFRSVRRLWTRHFTRTEKPASKTGIYSLVGPPTESKLYSKKYVKSEVGPQIEQHGMVLRKTVGFGFGPVTFLEREILPDRLTSFLSERLTRLSQRRLFGGLSYLANRWVFLAQKRRPQFEPGTCSDFSTLEGGSIR